MSDTAAKTLTWAIFALVYVGLALGKIPLLRLDRAGIALVGATAMLVFQLVGFDEAVHAVDFPTIALLFGMMVVVAYLRLGGFFRRLAEQVLGRARTPHGVLALVILLSGVLSAFAVNDIVCLALVPIVVRLAERVRRSPLPYLVALATSANVGSAATITGNPQNMIIGALSRIPYASFAGRLAPVAAIGLVLDYVMVSVTFRRALAHELSEARPSILAPDPAGEPEADLLPKGVTVLLISIGLFFAGAPVALVALGAGAVLMLGRVRPERIYSQIDWNLLVMFAGLFVVVHAFETHVVSGWDLARLASMAHAPVLGLTVVAAALSNLVSNVPAVLLLKALVLSLEPAAHANGWLTLAMASTLSGNLTPVASVANLIVVEGARRGGVEISLVDYCRVGVPLTMLTLAIGAAWLTWVG